ncbi:MAG: DNA polymerase Y family protein [Christensenellales bacterium]|jgi:DNA polymerase-4
MDSILHCDLNNFYASVECLKNPSLSLQPLAVGGSEKDRHGIVLAKNIPAKAFDIRTGETLHSARRKCPGLIVVPPNFPLYSHYAQLTREIYLSYTPQCEPFGIDEAWLDIRGTGHSPVHLANTLRAQIKKELGLTISVGVSFNKIFAKLGSDMKKPDATTLISPCNFRTLVWPLPVGFLLYVGRKTCQKLHTINVHTIGDLAHTPKELLRALLGKQGEMIHSYANGEDRSPVALLTSVRTPKSISNGFTAKADLCSLREATEFLYPLCESIACRLRRHALKGTTLQLSIKSADLSVTQRQAPLPTPTWLCSEIAPAALRLLENHWPFPQPIRALSVRLTGLFPYESAQLSFFENPQAQRLDSLEHTLDLLRSRYGNSAVSRAISLNSRFYPDNFNPLPTSGPLLP